MALSIDNDFLSFWKRVPIFLFQSQVIFIYNSNIGHMNSIDIYMLETIMYPMICMYRLLYNYEVFFVLYIGNMNNGSYMHMAPSLPLSSNPPPPGVSVPHDIRSIPYCPSTTIQANYLLKFSILESKFLCGIVKYTPKLKPFIYWQKFKDFLLSLNEHIGPPNYVNNCN